MARKSITFNIFLLLIGLCQVFFHQTNAHPQDPFPPLLTLTLDAQVVDADVFYISDTSFKLQNIATPGRSPFLLTFHVTSNQNTDAIFGLEVIADIDVIGSYVEIYKGFTSPISLQANQRRIFSNRDLAKGGVLEIYEDETIDISASRSTARRLIDVIRATSRLPDGTYIFRITAYRPGQTSYPYHPLLELQTVERYLKIINPSRIDLLSPSDGEKLLTQYPLFQWRSDTHTVILRVFEIRSETQTRDEVLTGVPHLSRRITGGQNQFFYPQAQPGVRNLEPGKSYVWNIEGLYRTSANTEETIPSEIFTFTVLGPFQVSSVDAFLLHLKNITKGMFDEIIEEIARSNLQSIDDFYLDNLQISQQEYRAIMAALENRAKNAEIVNIEIE